MGHPRAGEPAGATATVVVVVPVDAAAPAAGGALVVAPVAAAAAQAPPAWTRRLSARLVWLLAVALFLLGCAEAGLALSSTILPSGTKASCAATTDAAKAPDRLILGVFMQLLSAMMALSGPEAWQLAVYGTGMGILTAYVLPAGDILWLVACDGALAFDFFWLVYVVMLPAFAIGAVVCFVQSESEED